MSYTLEPRQLGFSLAWRFSEVLEGSFERDRIEVRGIKFPIVGPLPSRGSATAPLEDAALDGPYLYLVVDGAFALKYVGVATEAGLASPLKRWIRPNSDKTRDFWAHGTNKRSAKATVVWLEEGLSRSEGPYQLFFTNHERVTHELSRAGAPAGLLDETTPRRLLENVEHAVAYLFQPEWNVQKKKTQPASSILDPVQEWFAPT